MGLKTVTLRSWVDFESATQSVIDEFRKRRSAEAWSVPPPLFRGQRNAEWPLLTTLERFVGAREYAVDQYYRVMRSVKPIVEVMTQKSWTVPDRVEESVYSYSSGYEFMAYLRQHGFPSPLLDWSRSPYVAAFFAFRSDLPNAKQEPVAVYAYVESLDGSKSGFEHDGQISGRLGGMIPHLRHYRQQSDYTVCRKKVDAGMVYCSHEDVYARDEQRQDLLTKYLLPACERDSVLRKLDSMNINSYSLFSSDDSLMETLADRARLEGTL